MKKYILTAVVLLSIASCGGEKKEEVAKNETETKTAPSAEKPVSEPATVSAPVPEAPKVSLVSDVSTLQKAEAALKELPKFKGKEIMVFQNIHFYGNDANMIIVTLQDPDKPENVDEYKFTGGEWQAPNPVTLTGKGNMSANVFPLSSIKFETVANIQKQLDEKAKTVEGVELDGHIYLVLLSGGEKKWYTQIKGTRESFSGYFKPDGTLREFKKN